MMNVFESRNGNQLYPRMLRTVLSKGRTVSPRGLRTRELYPAITIIRNPRERVLTVSGRGGNPFFLVAEALWILAGRGDVDFITYYNSKMADYADKGYSGFHGAYGKRMRAYGEYKNGASLCCTVAPVDQLAAVYKKLRKDKHTRQAVMSLWNPYFDNGIRTKDIPCNNLSMFKIRDSRLHLHQVIRSNDLNKGLFPTNLMQWSMVQEVLAGWLSVEVGELLFFSDSLHVYDSDEITKKVLRQKSSFDVYEHVKPLDARLPKPEFDKVLRAIMHDESLMRNGRLSDYQRLTRWKTRALLHDKPFWLSLWKILGIWSLRKKGLEEQALDLALSIEAPDLRISVLEYMYRNSKNPLLYGYALAALPKPIHNYVIHNRGVSE